VVPDEIMAKMSGKDNPPLLLGAYRQPRLGLADSTARPRPLWFVAEKLRDPGNIGTILRTGDAVARAG
jgi:TrmH family RNA methyltransferase